jgi:hypothetical protein
VVKSPPIANLQTVIGHPLMTNNEMRNFICVLILLNSLSCLGCVVRDTTKVIARHIESVDVGELRSSTFKVLKQIVGYRIQDTLLVFSSTDTPKLDNAEDVMLGLVERLCDSTNAESFAFPGFDLVQAILSVEVISVVYDEWDHCYQTPTEKKTRTIIRNAHSNPIYLFAPCSNTGTLLQLFVYGYNIALSENDGSGLECPPFLDLTNRADGWYFAALSAEGICLKIDLIIETKSD